MTSEPLTLVTPSLDFAEEFFALGADFLASGESRYFDVPEWARQDFAAYLRHLANEAAGLNLHHGRVTQRTYWLVRDGRTIVGVSHLRHPLADWLYHEGGHIGYAIRPTERRKGYGTQILAMTLLQARDIGLPRVLVTCDTDNLGSARIIQHNGGVLENEVISYHSGKPVSRYWITLS